LRPTGYVHETRPGRAAHLSRGDDVLVSGGGSAAALPLCRAAIDASHLVPARSWRILCGHGIPEDAFAALRSAAPANAVVERARADFPSLLAACRVSVSQAGYNTVLDLAAAGARAVLVPFAEGGEVEQSLRARALAERGRAIILPADELTAARLVAAIGEAEARPAPNWSDLARDGVARSVAFIEQEAARAASLDGAWRRLDTTLTALERDGRVVPVWLRDDDAVAETAALRSFLDRMAAHGLPVGIATIPAALAPNLADLVATGPHALLVHGWRHVSHAPPGSKTSEFPDGRDAEDMARDLADGLRVVREASGGAALPIFVPPWNRIGRYATTLVASAGYTALSASATTRRLAAAATPPRLDVQWDPIDWRGTRGLADEVMLLDRLSALLSEEFEPARHAPLGLLTHHAVHDGWVDRFIDEVLHRLSASPAIRFVPPAEALAALRV
jgi:hypothetical protein